VCVFLFILSYLALLGQRGGHIDVRCLETVTKDCASGTSQK